MEEIKDKLDELLVKISELENLSELLEDYFYNSPNQKEREFCKHLSLSTVVVEKVSKLDEMASNIWDLLINLKKTDN